MAGAVTVNATPLDEPETVTTTLPVVAIKGTVTMMLVADHEVAIAGTPLKVTVEVPWGDPKLVPVIVTGVPTGPEVTERDVMFGLDGIK